MAGRALLAAPTINVRKAIIRIEEQAATIERRRVVKRIRKQAHAELAAWGLSEQFDAILDALGDE